MEALKDLYNIYVNHYRVEDSKEVSAARDRLEKFFGENYTREIEDIAGDLGYFSNEQGFIEGFRYAASLLTNTHSSVGNLEELMQNEYDAVTSMDSPMSALVNEALKMVRAKITNKEYLEIENNMLGSYNYAEKFGFEQGFMRGIAVAKGGAI